MKYTVLTFSQDSKYLQKFLQLPKRLYHRTERMQKPVEELEILKGTHILSHYFQVCPLLVLDKKERPISRAVLTIYPKDSTAYLGFFESEDNETASALLFSKAENLAKKYNCTEIVGPVDASFWLCYRLKTNHFGAPYTGEPYNKDYYLRLWQQAGYCISERYFSNHFQSIKSSHQNTKFSARLEQKRMEGYHIISPDRDTFDASLQEVYELLVELYKTFPVYKPITKEEFISLYSYLKPLINYSMVKMAYYQKQPVGFFISIPDYGNTVYGTLTPTDYLHILLTRKKPKSYVMLYMGIDASHHGLGKAMAEAIKQELQVSGIPSVGALIREKNINRHYFQELIDYEYEYVLLHKVLTS